MRATGVDCSMTNEQADAYREAGETVMFLAINGHASALLRLTDPIKESTLDALKSLRGNGMRIVMATGDDEITARAVGNRLNIWDIHATLSPEEKASLVKGLQKRAAASLWQATALMTHQRWRKQTLVLQWALVRMSHWKAQVSRLLKETCMALCGPNR